jgi:hypothetical protein
MKETKIKKIIIILTLIGVFFSVYLVINEIIEPSFCPSFYFIPACYMVLIAYSSVLISTIFKGNNFSTILLNFGLIMGLIIGINYSLRQLFMIEQCPKLFEIPLCYASLCLFLIIGLIQYSKIIQNFRKPR